MKNIIYFLLFCITFSVSAQTNPKKEIISRMLNANVALRTAKFTMHTEERLISGKFEIKDMRIKFQHNPVKVYLFAVKPDFGTQIIWKKGWNDDKMYVSPGSFPYVNFSLKTNNSLARKDAHHPITNMGFDYLSGLLTYFIKASGDKFYDNISITDTVQWDNRSCILVKFDYKDFKEINYTVKSGENISSIADKLHLNDYSILMLNPAVSDYDDVKPNQIIRIPNFYCRSIEFYIDRATWLPLKQVISDNKGIYENYEMKSFLLNPVFKADEFDTEFAEYKF